MEYERVVKLLKRASPVQKGEVLGRAVRGIIDECNASATTNLNKRRWQYYDMDKRLSAIVKADKEAMQDQ